MELASFENDTGEGVVSFEPWRMGGEDSSKFYCHLTVAGERIFEYGCPCGTCGILFRKVGSTAHRLDDAESVELLGALDSVPEDEVLRRLARVLEPGLYHPTVLEGTIRLIEPGAPDDYFATDVVRLFGLEAPEYEEPSGPWTSYYKLGSDCELERTGRLRGPHKALVTAVVMPLHDPAQLDRDRVEHWKRQQEAGRNLTAFAVSVLDNQQPAMEVKDPTYAYAEQFLLTSCLLDGHHRVQAAAETGAPLRILSLLARDFSLAQTEDLASVLGRYSR
jgi:hypothetical protein